MKTSLINIDFTLRTMGALDEEFSYLVYASTRAEEMKLIDWAEDQKTAFMRMQFNAQHQHYQMHYPQALWQVIEQDAHAIGRFITDDSDSKVLLLMDIALLPEYRGKGIGSAILQDLLQTASQANKVISLHVEPNNPALNLYQRLGFIVCGQIGFYLEMKRQPDQGAAR